MSIGKKIVSLIALLVIALAMYWFYPIALFQVMEWQRQFNHELSALMNQLQSHREQAGWSLIFVSFLYGVFHAVGPGHGKFILSSYLSLESTKLPQMMKITLLSALVQGWVAIALVSVVVVMFSLSRHYFNLTLQWVERGSFILMMVFGLYWLYQAGRFWQKNTRKSPRVIRKITAISATNAPLISVKQPHIHSENCGCGHKHLPSAQEMAQVTSWKTTVMLILSIGLRPCSGAISVLFLSYTLDLYVWGVLSALAMAVGTGLTLTLFALLVVTARHKALQASRWYFSIQTSKWLGWGIKAVLGVVLMLFGLLLLQGSFIDTTVNPLFRR